MIDPGARAPDRSVAPPWAGAHWPPPPRAEVQPVGPARERPRWRGTILVGAIVAAVVLGGEVADAAIAAPSAGEVAVSGPVHVAAAPGWTLATAVGNVQDGVALQRGQALVVVQVVSNAYSSDDAQLLADAEQSLAASAGQIWFGGEKRVELGGRSASEATFSALLSGKGGSGILDGELVCLVIPSGTGRYAVVLHVGVPQGTLGSVTYDVDAMAASVAVGE